MTFLLLGSSTVIWSSDTALLSGAATQQIWQQTTTVTGVVKDAGIGSP